MCFEIADFALEQSCRVGFLAIVSRSKFADTKLEEAAAFFCLHFPLIPFPLLDLWLVVQALR